MAKGDLNWIANCMWGIADYRRLVADVVTGKLDVRQAAADLDERAVTDGIGVTKGGAVQYSRGTHGRIATEATS